MFRKPDLYMPSSEKEDFLWRQLLVLNDALLDRGATAYEKLLNSIPEERVFINGDKKNFVIKASEIEDILDEYSIEDIPGYCVRGKKRLRTRIISLFSFLKKSHYV